MITHEQPPEGMDHPKTLHERGWELFQVVLGLGLLGGLGIAIVAFTLGQALIPEDTPYLVLRALRHVAVVVDNRLQGHERFLILLVVGSLATLLLLWRNKHRQGLRAVVAVILAGLIVVGLGGRLLWEATVWGWILATLPALLVVHHGLYLGLIKPRFIPREIPLRATSLDAEARLKEFIEASDRYFSPTNLALRYGLPALTILVIGGAVYYTLNPVTKWALNKTLVEGGKLLITEHTLEAARFGAAGAYVYVLLYLGLRGFRHDITSGSALWCAVTLALGPVLSAVVAEIGSLGAGVGQGQEIGWTTQALYFGVGLAPRHLAQAAARMVRRATVDPSHVVFQERSAPLMQIRGITLQVEERLLEEGIYDVAALAMADPLRLQRNTHFDKHQILDWMDAALLMHALPENWEALDKKGIRGARALSWYVSTRPAQGPRDEAFQALADGILRPELLWDVALRLDEDAQLQRLRLLYQLAAKTEAHPASLSKDPFQESATTGLGGLVNQLQSAPPAAEKREPASASGEADGPRPG